MELQYDPVKSKANAEKHGIDFDEALSLWDDEDRIELRTPYAAEERWLIVGVIAGKHWSAIVTYRGESVRLISVRRSREKEEGAYEDNKR